MKIDTKDKKMAFLLGYTQALAEIHAKEFNLNVEEVKERLLREAI